MRTVFVIKNPIYVPDEKSKQRFKRGVTGNSGTDWEVIRTGEETDDARMGDL